MREMNVQLRQLSAALQDVREQERRRISRELHDELGQQLTGLKLDLSWLMGRMRDGKMAEPEKVDAMRHLLDAAIAGVRRISTELRPPMLDDLGFGAAVSWQANEFAKRTGIEVDVDIDEAKIGNDLVSTAFFRIVQESLTNVARHSGATRVDIRLAAVGGTLALTIQDNGRGMTADVRRGGGLGLIGIRERATGLGGSLSIASYPGAGTTVEVKVPLHVISESGNA
jgi:signal transduction histidine kinase